VKLTLISGAEVRRLVPMPLAIEAVASAFSQLSSGQARIPLRTPVQAERGVTLFMPGYLAETRVLGGKVVSVFGGNAALGLPVVTAAVLLLDPSTGLPRALLDGTQLTALRTGAASGLATRLLARENASVLAVFGAGAQARTQIEAVRAVRPIREVRIVDTSRASADRLASELRSAARPPEVVHVLEDPGAAVEGAQVIVAATTSDRPVFPGARVTAGTHVNGIGSYTPEMQEVDEGVVTRARVVVDTRDGALVEAGDLIIPLRKGLVREEDMRTELGEIVLGTRPGRTSESEITFFKSVGNAAMDLAVGARVLAEAERLGAGTTVEL
jgi:ornithine cyclodeaminase/alanine dehydrogenase-like protein (mu-crystallin family)